ncbi:MAG TPA: CBS domain-containing protein [Anaerolineales bacterium]|nr:CBS domain-containing protein [Anaerolineales bacterium]
MTPKNLTPLLVRDLMSVGVPTCPLETPVIDLAKKMLEKDWESVVVLEGEQGHAVGMVSQKELVQAYASGDPTELTAEDIMGERLPTVPPDIPITTAAQIMLDEGVRAVYITHHAGGIKYPAAWLTLKHLLRYMSGDDLSDLGIRAAREKPLDLFLRRRDEARMRAGFNKD